MDKAKVLRFFRNGLIIFLIMFGMVWVKTYSSGRAQYLEGEENLKAGHMKEAISNYEASIHMYAPMAGYVDASAQRLWEIGQGYESSGDYDWSLIAYRALRSSFYATRSFYTPGTAWISRSEAQINQVLIAQHEVEKNKAKPGGK